VNQPKDWKSLARHPLSAEYEDIVGPAWVRFVADMREQRYDPAKPIVLLDGQILDGWQRQRACVMTFVTPVYIEYDGDDPEAYVRRVNDNRRHETPLQQEQRIERRRERVAAARVEGQSIRSIAEKEGVSVGTVQNDIEEATVQGHTVEPPNGTVVGKDKKKRKATGTKKPRKKKGKRISPSPHSGNVGQSFDEQIQKCHEQLEECYDDLLLILDRRAQAMGKDKCYTACINAAFEARKHYKESEKQYKAWVSA